jgi:hypothetical protein
MRQEKPALLVWSTLEYLYDFEAETIAAKVSAGLKERRFRRF